MVRNSVRRFLGLCCGLIVGGALALSTSGAAHASEMRRTATVKLVQQARPSIVNIHGQKTLGPGEEGFRRGEAQNVNGMGTGVVIDERGYILTNHHVVDGVKKIEVTLADRQEYVGTRVAHDPKTDLAIIKINVPRKLPVIKIGISSDLMIGESVVAIGNAYGYEHTVTRGVISEVHRTVRVSDSQDYKDLIQTDASINPGNSGGPLLNIDGEMIGINVAVRAGAQGIGFAIPVDAVMAVAAELVSAQHNTWHGIISKQPGPATIRQCVVNRVDADSPAAKCGLQPGDVIASVGESPVSRALDLERALLGHQPGEEIVLAVERNKKPVNINLTLVAAPKRINDADRIWETLGLRLAPAPSTQLKGYQKQYRGGLLVTEVKPDSPAFREGIHRGDILLGMHIWETISLENVNYILKNSELASLQPLKFLILRNDVRYEGELTVSMRKQTRDR
jgi:serine protease Do